ncbi:uncharacterized protein LOC135401046 isoform X2 [Ornithodoros turicata]|uniref:uncharacterized protein LOC135401046 isoform X2 n=1 Tax=Ornithodoros turicata TaxID=34597 RepID=UPI00313974EB
MLPQVGGRCCGMCHCILAVLAFLSAVLDRRTSATDVDIRPVIIYPRNITMGYDDYVRYECRFIGHEHKDKISDVRWLHNDTLIVSDKRRTVTVSSEEEGSVTYLEVRNLKEGDSGPYTCTADPAPIGTIKITVGSDTVYLALTDYRAAHWGEPCRFENGTQPCVDLNTDCYLVTPPARLSPTKYSCQCKDDYPIFYPQRFMCDKGSKLGVTCHEPHQCSWFTQYAECVDGTCQCTQGYVANDDYSECFKASEVGEPCAGNWQCRLNDLICIDSVCQRDPPPVSTGQAAILALLALVGLFLLIFLAVLLHRCRRYGKVSKTQTPSIYVIPMNNSATC